QQPPSPLFPYTTLFRSGGPGGLDEAPAPDPEAADRLSGRVLRGGLDRRQARPATFSANEGAAQLAKRFSSGLGDAGLVGSRQIRSEEHTSELQSLRHLV